MTSEPSVPRRTFITPLSRPDLIDPGQVFRREELRRRVLSAFWQDCCSVPGLARAPAPIVELSGAGAGPDGNDSRVRAWWILYDGIVEESDGPHSERLTLFFGRGGALGQLWPRYEFRVLESPFAVVMSFHQEPGLSWASRVGLDLLPNGCVRITVQERARNG